MTCSALVLMLLNLSIPTWCVRQFSLSSESRFPAIDITESPTIAKWLNFTDLMGDQNHSKVNPTRPGLIINTHTKISSESPTPQSSNSPTHSKYPTVTIQPCALSPHPASRNSPYDMKPTWMTGDMSSDSPMLPPTDAYGYHPPDFMEFSEDRANHSREIGDSSLNFEVGGNVPKRGPTYRIPHTVSLLPPTTPQNFDEFPNGAFSSNRSPGGLSVLSEISSDSVSTALNWMQSEPATNYCLEGVPIVDINTDGCPTCEGRCGDALSLKAVRLFCSCDSSCLAYNDCCPDFQLTCPEEHSQGVSALSSISGSQGSACFPLKMVDGSTGRFLFIDKCNGTRYKFMNTGGLPNVNDGVPVEDLDTGLFYINYDCAKVMDPHVCDRCRLLYISFCHHAMTLTAMDWSSSVHPNPKPHQCTRITEKHLWSQHPRLLTPWAERKVGKPIKSICILTKENQRWPSSKCQEAQLNYDSNLWTSERGNVMMRWLPHAPYYAQTHSWKNYAWTLDYCTARTSMMASFTKMSTVPYVTPSRLTAWCVDIQYITVMVTHPLALNHQKYRPSHSLCCLTSMVLQVSVQCQLYVTKTKFFSQVAWLVVILFVLVGMIFKMINVCNWIHRKITLGISYINLK